MSKHTLLNELNVHPLVLILAMDVPSNNYKFLLCIFIHAGCLYNLVSLNLNHNCLHSLPHDIHFLTHLQCLSLSSNHISLLPVELGSLYHLTELHLDNNELTCLPNEIGMLTRLKKLMLQKNELASLPPVRMIYSGTPSMRTPLK